MDRLVFFHRRKDHFCLILFVGTRCEVGIDSMGLWGFGFMWYWKRNGNLRRLINRINAFNLLN